MRKHCREATASDSNSPKIHRRESYLASVQMKPVILNLLRCRSNELYSRVNIFRTTTTQNKFPKQIIIRKKSEALLAPVASK
jgi:hypothetical protein